MNGLEIRPHMPAEESCARPESEVTAVGGMATCPTSAIYWIPVHSGTPIERISGQIQLPVGRVQDLQTWPSYDLLRMLGPTIAEPPGPRNAAPTTLPSCPQIEHREIVRRLSVATHLSGAMKAWEEASKLIQRLEAPSRSEPGPRSWEAFKEVASWLDVTDGELAAVIGIGRTTVYSWQREDREPRRGTARRLHQLHAALGALQRRLGEEGLETWFATGSPNRRQLILDGEIEALGDDIDAQLFGTISQPDLAAAPVDRGGVESFPAGVPPKPSSRKPRQARLR